MASTSGSDSGAFPRPGFRNGGDFPGFDGGGGDFPRCDMRRLCTGSTTRSKRAVQRFTRPGVQGLRAPAQRQTPDSGPARQPPSLSVNWPRNVTVNASMTRGFSATSA